GGGLEGEEGFLGIDHPTPAVGRELEDAGVHPDGVFGTRLDAVAAEHALTEVDVEAGRHLLDLGVRVLVGDDVNAARRANGLAHHARHAARRAVFSADESVQAAQARRQAAPLVRILDRDGAPGVAAPERVRDVPAHVAEEVAPGEAESRQHLAEIEPLAEFHAGLVTSKTSPVSTMLAIESGKSASQPRRMA